MHIGLDARTMLGDRPRGTGRNLRDAYAAIRAARPDWRITLFGRRVDEAVGPLPGEVRRFDCRGDRWDMWLHVGLPLAAWRRGADLLHCGANDAPVWSATPLVGTLHDLAPLEVPGFAPAARQRFERAARRIIRRARIVLTPSAATRDALRTRLGAAGDRIKVVPWAPDAELVRRLGTTPPQARRDQVAAVAARYALGERWLLNFSGPCPRKNAERLIAAYARLPRVVRAEHRLVLTGCHPASCRARLARVAEDAGVADDCRLLGFVCEAELAWLLAGAAAVVVPTLCEGFGLPVVDAFAARVPVVISDTPALREVAGDAALRCDPMAPDRIAAALREVLAVGIAHDLITRGARRLEHFSWEGTANAMVAAFEAAVHSPSARTRPGCSPPTRAAAPLEGAA